jgi:hypothetical protein
MSHHFPHIVRFSLATALTLNLALASAQTVNCNGLLEQPGQGPGKIPGTELTDNCVQVNINGNLITPAQCTKGYTHFDIQQHSCGQGAPSTYCKWNAYKLTISKFAGGGCPQIPDLTGIDWTSIGDIIGAIPRLIAALGCQEPEATTEKSDSAASQNCVTGGGGEPLEGQVLANTSEGTATWNGTVAQGTQGPAGTVNPFLTPYEAAQTATPQAFGGALGAVAAAQTGVDGVQFHASLLVEHFDDANATQTSHSREIVYWGKFCTDGRFDVQTIIPAVYDGKPSPTNSRRTFDGHHLRSFVAQAETGNRFDMTSPTSSWVDDVYLEGLMELYTWCTDTYDIPLFPGITYAEAPGAAPSTLDVTRSHPLVGGESFVSEKYTLSTRVTPAIPLSRSDYDVAGFAWNTYEYSNFTEFRSGDTRPLLVKTTRFFGSGQNLRKVETTLRVDFAKPLTAADSLLVPNPMSDDIKWVEWTF